MAWNPQVLAEALQTLQELNIDIENNERSLIIKMNDYGDLPLSVLFTSRRLLLKPLFVLSAVFISKMSLMFSYCVIRNSFLCLPWGFHAFSMMNITSHLGRFP
jgi:uncharacterized protein YjfI (DUF2170 family)